MGKEKNFGTKINSNGFSKNPENINRKGRPVSIRQNLKDMLENEGELRVDPENVISVNKDGSVSIKLPKTDAITYKLMDWAINGNGNESIKAIQIMLEQIDGKPNKTIDVNERLEIPLIDITITRWVE
jgi:hypothetical protein